MYLRELIEAIQAIVVLQQPIQKKENVKSSSFVRRHTLCRIPLLALLLVTVGCGNRFRTETTPSQPLVVFAAASLSEPFEAIGAEFEAVHPDVEVIFNFGGSQQLAQQLIAGAPGDVYASASEQQMAGVVTSGRVVSDEVSLFATNKLLVILPATNPAALASLADLAGPGLKLVLAAPEVPAGAYTLEFLKRANADPNFPPSFSERVLENVVSYEQNVRAVLTKVALGEADAGIVYNSDAAGDYRSQLETLEIPVHLNPTAAYPIAPLADSEQPALAQVFTNFVLSTEAQQILVDYGFQPLP